MTAAIATDSFSAQVASGIVDDVVGTVVVGIAVVDDVDEARATAAFGSSPDEHAVNDMPEINRPSESRKGSENMSLPNRTYNPAPIYANGVPFDMTTTLTADFVRSVSTIVS
jgi:hypothetical protein